MLKILTVDDSGTIRKLMVHLIGKIAPQFEVIEASNGIDALKVAEGAGAELAVAFVDYNMEGMNGVAVIESLKATHPHTQLFICSANIQQVVKDRVAKLGAGHIAKPLTEEKLREALKQAGIQ